MTMTSGLSTSTDESTGASIGLGVTTDQPTRTILELVADVEEAGFYHNFAQILVEDSSEMREATGQLHGHRVDELLRTLTTHRTRHAYSETLEELSALGFSWKAVARLAGVSVPAVRKWRQGESAPSGDNRRRIARLASFCELVEEQYAIRDVAGWLETPLHSDAPVTGLDLLEEERFDLALRLASDGGTDPELILDEVRPDWRERYSSQVEVFMASDGMLALRLGEGDS